MTTNAISFQGELGANSHTACLEAYPDMTPLPCPTFEDAFAAVVDGEADLAMIPIENSLAGRVADIHQLLPSSGLHIVAEHFLRIRHTLMALPGVAIEELRTVQSHVQALDQCRGSIRKLGLARIVGADTAGSARQVAERGERSAAAIAPPLAADIYKLDVLAENLEDESHNATRFIVLSMDAGRPSAGGDVVTSFLFRVRNIPAALYKGLGGFATNGVNMTKLESYQTGGRFFASQFYAEVDGHPDDEPLARALEELGFFSAELNILGVYPASPMRTALREGAAPDAD